MENTVTQSPFEMMDMDEAFELVDKTALEYPKRITQKSIDDIYGYVLAKDVISTVNIPPFRASIMDGYAFKRQEYENETEFTLVDTRSLAGVDDKSIDALPIPKCSIMYVTTGSPVNPNFDIVIPIELTCKEDEADVQVLSVKSEEKQFFIKREPVNNDWIRAVGCDISIGQVVLETNTRIGCSEIGILASIGCTDEIDVFEKPIIGLAASGNEIIS